MKTHPVSFPRFRIRRAFSRGVLRTLLPRLARIELSGVENLPSEGPLILAGNHSGMLEVLLMVAFAPKHLELIGAGDIPMDPRYVLITHLYNYIPINRGNTDSAALRAAVGVLEQNGVLGIFPEGGIWESERSRAQKGVSWISGMSRVPVVPVGFGGLVGAWGKLIRFKHPRLTVSFGPAVPPPDLSDRRNRKSLLEDHAERIMDGIQECIPEEYRRNFVPPESEEFSFSVTDSKGEELGGSLNDGGALGHFFFKPVLLDTLRRNLKRKVGVLEKLEREHSAADFKLAVDEILAYLKENPNFFTYRFGNDLGTRIGKSLQDLSELLSGLDGEALRFSVERRFRYPGESKETVQTLP